MRLYAPAALRRGGRDALYSNHWSGGAQVFYAYHWLVRPDGGVERLLHDRHVGWHAGDWEVNRASVGICLAGDYSRQRPTAAALAAVRGVLRRYPGATLVLHRDVNGATDCPGPWASAGELACAHP
jgi:N-acetyl-anhydromuramyl-L-alanine amidase AmpD